jgi:hypothetical protein
MIIKLGQFNINGTYTDVKGAKVEAKINFSGYSYEISVAELCEWMTTKFSLFREFIQGMFKAIIMIRKDIPNWVACYNGAMMLAEKGQRDRTQAKIEFETRLGELNEKTMAESAARIQMYMEEYSKAMK